MSQEKVNQYKEEKKNRKARLKKEKRLKTMWKILTPIIALLIVAAIGAAVYFIPKWTQDVKDQQAGDTVDYEQLMQMINEQGGNLSDNAITIDPADSGDSEAE